MNYILNRSKNDQNVGILCFMSIAPGMIEHFFEKEFLKNEIPFPEIEKGISGLHNAQ